MPCPAAPTPSPPRAPSFHHRFLVLQVIATGAGAALCLDFVAYVRANELVPARGVKVYYSSASLPLLQFVTNTLLAERTDGIEIKTALTRHDDLQV